jgi:hypothetical protein
MNQRLTLASMVVVATTLAIARGDEPAAAPYHPRYEGNTTCLGCHSKAADDTTFPHDFCLVNEGSVWQQQDKHAQSFRILAGVSTAEGTTRLDPQALGLVMLRRLTGDLLADRFAELEQAAERNQPEVYLQAAVALFLDKRSSIGFSCLTCHANLKPEEQYVAVLDDQQFRKNFVENAVSCEACHGPSELWGREHYSVGKKLTVDDLPRRVQLSDEQAKTLEGKTWRELSVGLKQALGFYEVRSPVRRAEQCFSCHIGDKNEGKYIEHSWYVAGHPPLPGIELATFANDMPRHWRHLAEKGKFAQREEFLAAQETREEEQTFPESKAVLVGSAVALRTTVNLLSAVRSEGKFLPDFAAYDCLACHQQLRTEPVVTRERLDPHTPGRPGLPRWSTALIEVACDVVDESGKEKEHFLNAYDDLRGNLSQRPFGDTRTMVEHAGIVADRLKAIEERILALPLTEDDIRRAQQAVLTASRYERYDYHSARQIAWALRRFQTELASEPDFAKDDGLAAARRFPEWFKTVRQAQQEQVMAGEPPFLQLRLPATQSQSIEQYLSQWLEGANRYEPGDYVRWQSRPVQLPAPAAN